MKIETGTASYGKRDVVFAKSFFALFIVDLCNKLCCKVGIIERRRV